MTAAIVFYGLALLGGGLYCGYLIGVQCERMKNLAKED